MQQQTLILLKPDAVRGKFCGKVISRFEEAGFTIRGCKMIHPSAVVFRDHYAHIADKPFYPEVEKFMRSSPVIAMVIEGDNVVDRVREMLGVTDSLQAAPGTLRNMFGSKDAKTSKMVNVAHASDSVEAAKKEVARFFKEEELFSY